jgi:hypothetical protein
MGLIIIGAGISSLVGQRASGQAQIRERQSALPLAIGNRDSPVVAFFPIRARPSAIEISYIEGEVAHVLRMNTRAALSHAHIVDVRPQPSLPADAIRRGIDSGHVRAVLSIDASGAVTDVEDRAGFIAPPDRRGDRNLPHVQLSPVGG